jgi:hypothetical protein
MRLIFHEYSIAFFYVMIYITDLNEQLNENDYRSLIENIEFIHSIVLKKIFIYSI